MHVQMGRRASRSRELNARYHLLEDDIRNFTRIIFSTAEYDTISGVAPAYIPSTVDKCKSRLLYGNDMVYREELFAQ